MTHTQDSSLYPHDRTELRLETTVGLEGVWTVKERVNGVWVVRKQVRNKFTNYGLTAFASALGGGYTYPQYLALDNNYAVPSVQANPGDTAVLLNARIDQAGDTQITLGAGAGSQETLTFSGVSGTGPYTYTLSGTVANTHPITDYCCRAVNANDTMSSIVSEIQYDSTNFPSQRMQSPGGYSAGTGNFTVQFYFPGGTAQGVIVAGCLCDNPSIGAGNLHNRFLLGYNNNSSTNDLEIDGSITLTN